MVPKPVEAVPQAAPGAPAKLSRASRMRTRARKLIAVFEAVKGVAALAACAGLLSLLHHDLHSIALHLIGDFDLGILWRHSDSLLNAVDRLAQINRLHVLLFGLGYFALRGGEAWGLWHDRPWGSWLAIIAGGVYLPFELEHVWHRPGWISISVAGLNLALIVYLIWAWNRERKQRRAAQA